MAQHVVDWMAVLSWCSSSSKAMLSCPECAVSFGDGLRTGASTSCLQQVTAVSQMQAEPIAVHNVLWVQTCSMREANLSVIYLLACADRLRLVEVSFEPSVLHHCTKSQH